MPDKPPDPDEVNAGIIKVHGDASRDEVLGALRQARGEAAKYLGADQPNELDRVIVIATVGPLPALTILHAQLYELAVHALDLHSAGAPKPPKSLLDGGLARAGWIDTRSLAASQMNTAPSRRAAPR